MKIIKLEVGLPEYPPIPKTMKIEVQLPEKYLTIEELQKIKNPIPRECFLYPHYTRINESEYIKVWSQLYKNNK